MKKWFQTRWERFVFGYRTWCEAQRGLGAKTLRKAQRRLLYAALAGIAAVVCFGVGVAWLFRPPALPDITLPPASHTPGVASPLPKSPSPTTVNPPTPVPTATPRPTSAPTNKPTATPRPTATLRPTAKPTPRPSKSPTPSPTSTPEPTPVPTPTYSGGIGVTTPPPGQQTPLAEETPNVSASPDEERNQEGNP